MHKERHEKAKKKVEAKRAFYVCTVVFTAISAILLILTYALPSISLWLMIPIPVLFMVLGIIYLFAFGLPSTGPLNEEWEADEIEKEMIKSYRKQRAKLPPLEALPDQDHLELKELERLKRVESREDDYV